MNQVKDMFLKWKDKKYIIAFLTLFIILTIMVSSFYFSVIGGHPNLIAFIIVVFICFLTIILFLARHIYIGLILMVVGGLFGFMTDFWGTNNNVFIYDQDSITLMWLLLKGINQDGVPVEIVLSYFLASIWVLQIIESLFDKEIAELVEEYDSGVKNIKSYKQLVPALIVIIISIMVVISNPLVIQPWTYFSIGVVLTSLVPGNKKIIPIFFGIMVAPAGLFFELFCSGEIIPEAVIWAYINPDWGFEHTYRALIAYGGYGASLASVFLLLLKFPFFRKEITIINLQKSKNN